MEHLTPFFVILLLVMISLRNGFESKRGLTCIAVLWCTVPGYFIYQSDLYFPIVDVLGSYGFQSATPLLAIAVLSLIRCRLSTILMCLFTVLICANTYFFWLEGQNHNIQDAHQMFVWSIFFTEVALMLSPRLTNGIHGAIQGFIRHRDNVADEHIGYSRTLRTEDNSNEAST